MYGIDWYIVITMVIGLLFVAWYSKRHIQSVSDFLSANRCAGRYLLTISDGISGISLVSVLAVCEMYYRSGFVANWWISGTILITSFIAISGWVIYRFRETRAMTMAQFFELRYSKKFRIFAGMVCWFSGIINYGIFPIVTARVIVHLMGMPLTVSLAGLEVQTTSLVMPVVLVIAVYLTLSGGQIAVMVTDFLQGSFSSIVFITIIVYLFVKFGVLNLFDSFVQTPQSETMINPFKLKGGEFNGFFFASLTFMMFYGFMAWQGNQGYYSAAKNPHEARMAKVWSMWRGMFLWYMLLFAAIIGFTVFKNLNFASIAQPIQSSIAQIPDTQIQEQLRIPIMFRHILPSGLVGLLCAAFIGVAISTDDSNLHSWGSIFIQDVVLPLRKKRMSPKEHITFLRISVIGVAVFVYLFSMFFPLKDYLFMFMQITGAIFVGGAGCAIIGGLYWKRGTTAGAWSGMISGMFLAFLSIILQNVIWPYLLPGLKESYPNLIWLMKLPEKYPINGMVMSALVALIASTVYAVVSLMSRKPTFNMDRMLHRSQYAIASEHTEATDEPVKGWRRLFNFKGREFTKRDLFISYFSVGWGLLTLVIFIAGTAIAMVVEIPDKVWLWYWICMSVFTLVMGTVTTTIILLGGFRNMFEMFQYLKTAKRSETDDGTVIGHHNLADEEYLKY